MDNAYDQNDDTDCDDNHYHYFYKCIHITRLFGKMAKTGTRTGNPAEGMLKIAL